MKPFCKMEAVPPKKVLFLCIGNACRSQMAEGFARVYGKDVMIPASAGLAPAMSLPPLTKQVMKEKNVDLADHFPKDLKFMRNVQFDLLINMSAQKLPSTLTMPIEEWKVKDPIGKTEEVYRATRDDIEDRVMKLVLSLRKERG